MRFDFSQRSLWQQLFLGLLLGIAAAGFLYVLHGHESIADWLIWRYAGYWGAALLFVAAAFSLGHWSVMLVMRRSLPVLEHLCTSFAVGVLLFGWLMFLVGMVGGYRAAVFPTLPLFCLVVGGGSAWAYAKRVSRHVQAHRHRSPRLPLWALAIVGCGALLLFGVYFTTLSPENVQFDSRWKQMAMAEEYVAAGGIRRFAEGWTTSTRPALVSYLYAWGFLLRGLPLFDRMLICTHVEFVIFLITTLVAVPALVRQLAPRADPRLVWVARFLYPAVLVYDTTVSGGADHIGALFAVPIYLLTRRVARDFNPRLALVLAALASAAVMVKYTVAVLLLAAPAVYLSVRLVRLGVRARAKEPASPERWWWLRGSLLFLGASALLTTPLWLKNWIWHKTPFYPVMASRWPGQPWTEDATYMYRWGYQDHQMWRPEYSWEGLLESLKALATFSFEPSYWSNQHVNVPVFGSLLTLLLLPLLLVRGTRRLWGVIGWFHAGVFIWYWTHHQDRYLQALMPLVAAATAAAIMLLWRLRWPFVRAALGLLIAVQVIWCGDKIFYQNHVMSRSSLKAAIDLLSSGLHGKQRERFQIQERWVAVGRRVPRSGLVLLHDVHNHLGVGRRTLNDWPTWQFGLSYGLLGSPRGVYDKLREFGVTHLYWDRLRSVGYDTLAGDLMFFDFAMRRTVDHQTTSHGIVARMPDEAPAADFDDSVAMVVCKGPRYFPGLYRVSDLDVPVFGPRGEARYPSPRVPSDRADVIALTQQASFVVVEPACVSAMPAPAVADFKLVARRKRKQFGPRYDLYLRVRGVARPPPWKR